MQVSSKHHLDNISRLQLYHYHLLSTAWEAQDNSSSKSNDADTARNGLSTSPEDQLSQIPAKSHDERNPKTETDKGYESHEEDDKSGVPRFPAATNTNSTLRHSLHHRGNTDTSYRSDSCHGSHSDCCRADYTGDVIPRERPSHDREGCGEAGMEGKRRIVGLLAQEVREVLPDAVMETVSLNKYTKSPPSSITSKRAKITSPQRTKFWVPSVSIIRRFHSEHKSNESHSML